MLLARQPSSVTEDMVTSLTRRTICDILQEMACISDRAALAVGSLAAALAFSSACSLTGPLDGYAVGDKPSGSSQDGGTDSGSDAKSDTPQDNASGCPTGFDDCDNDPANGCETELTTDVAHCGTCDTACVVGNGTPGCVSGECVVVACEPGFEDCDDDPLTGCEADTATSAEHCGACGTACTYSHAQGACNAGSCSFANCDDGWANCDTQLQNGCETNTNISSDHCGACDNVCLQTPNSVPRCELGTCGLLCESGFGDCDDDVDSGCEVNLQIAVLHCGACDSPCSANNASPSCVSASCVLACNTGFDDCNADGADGCEIDLRSDPLHCNDCATVCPNVPSATATCEQGACGYSCNANFGDCNSDPADGCEIPLVTNGDHCGACGHSCMGGTCTNGRCAAETVVGNRNRPAGIVVDNTNVYWTDLWDNTLYRAPKSGGPPATIATGGVIGPLAIDGSTLYYPTGAAIRRIGTDGTGGQTVVAAESYVVSDLALDATRVFWLRLGTWSGSNYNGDGQVMRAPLGGGSPTPLASNQNRPRAIAVFGSTVFWVTEGTYTGATYNNDGAVLSVPVGGGATTTIASNQRKPCGIAATTNVVYWTTCGNGQVAKLEQGVPGVQVLATGQHASDGLVLHTGALFWPYAGFNPNDPTGEVSEFPLATAPFLIAAEQYQPYRVAVDDTHVYWTNNGSAGDPPNGDGAVIRVLR